MSSESSSYKLHVAAKVSGIDTLQLDCQDQIKPTISNGEVVVQVMAAAVNPSDVKATLGIMPHAVFPRTPGRDFAGIVVEGPDALKGLQVWGSGGDIGITGNGSHARYLVLPIAAVKEVPKGISMEEAGAVGVPFVTACEGFSRAGGVKAGQTVVVLGANGEKLSKQNGAQAIDTSEPLQALNQAAAALGLPAQSGGVEQALPVWTQAWADAWMRPEQQLRAT